MAARARRVLQVMPCNSFEVKATSAATQLLLAHHRPALHAVVPAGNPVEEKDAKALAKALKRNKKFSIRALLGVD